MLYYRPVPVVQPGPGGCSLFFPWKTVPSSQSWPWPPSRIASLPSEESSSLSLARGHGDGGAAWKNRSGIYAVQKRVRSFVGSLLDWFTLYVFTRSFSPASVYSQMLIPVSRSPPERLSVLLRVSGGSQRWHEGVPAFFLYPASPNQLHYSWVNPTTTHF